VSLDAVSGTSVSVYSANGSVTSVAGNPIQSAGHVGMQAATGITVNTLAASVSALNHNSGNISITQAASPARPLATAPFGTIGGAKAGSITLSAAVGPFNGGNTLALISNNGINQFFGAPLTAANLRVNSPLVSMSVPNNNVGTLAGSASGGNLAFSSSTPLIIGTVDGVTGVVTTGGFLSLAADGLDVQQALSAPNSVL